MSDFMVGVGLVVIASWVTVLWKALMNPDTPVWADLEVGIELLVAGGSLVVTSLVTQDTRFTSARLLLLLLVGAFLAGTCAWARFFGHDAAGEMTKRCVLTLDAAGMFALAGVFTLNASPGRAHDIWHSIFS